MKRAVVVLAMILAVLACPAAHAAAAGFYRLQSAVTLPGKSPAWDHVVLAPDRRHLFIGRRKDGVVVYDIARHAVSSTIAGSAGANTVVLVPEYDTGYSVNEDGSSTMFRLSSGKTLGRIRLGASADAGFYDPVTRQILFTMGDDGALAFVAARTGKVTGVLKMNSRKLETAAADGRGGFFLAIRDRNVLARIDARKRQVTATWPTPGCDEPTGLAFDAMHRRVFLGCRGARPVLSVIDAMSGRTVATLPIGRGNDGVVYDGGMIYTSNGVDGNLVVVRQRDADRYALLEASTTRPGARTMAFDPVTKTIYLITSEGAVDPSRPVLTSVAPFYPNVFFDDTFTVLTYTRR